MSFLSACPTSSVNLAHLFQPSGRTPQDLAKTPEIKELLVPCFSKLGNIHVGNIRAVFLDQVYDKSFWQELGFDLGWSLIFPGKVLVFGCI